MPDRRFQFGFATIAGVFTCLGLLLCFAKAFGLEWLILFFPTTLALSAFVSKEAAWVVPAGAGAGTVGGALGLLAPAALWWLAPMESSAASENHVSALVFFAFYGILGSVGGLIVGILCGLREQLCRWNWTGAERDAPWILAATFLGVWTVFPLILSIDPWVYVNGERDWFMPFEGRMSISYFFGTIFSIIFFPLIWYIATLGYLAAANVKQERTREKYAVTVEPIDPMRDREALR